jgi:putative FmdB family regulatory protein
VPTYRYHCQKCGADFEHSEHVKDHEEKRHRCPKCKTTKVTTVPGAFFAKTSRKS